MAVKLKPDQDRITVGDLMDLEEQPESAKVIANILARLVVNGNGEYVEHEEGLQAVRGMTLAELQEASEAVQAAVSSDGSDPK